MHVALERSRQNSALPPSRAISGPATQSAPEPEHRSVRSIALNREFVGSIEAEQTVTIEAGATFRGSVKADRAIVRGVFDGQVVAREVQVEDGACVRGEIEYRTLAIAPGATLDASFRMTADATPTAMVSDPARRRQRSGRRRSPDEVERLLRSVARPDRGVRRSA